LSLFACPSVAYGDSMTPPRIALVTGANQGLGRALADGLAAGMAREDIVLLTGRDPERVRAAAAQASHNAVARVQGRVLDVRNRDAIAALAAELGEVDIVFSNATARMSPDADPAGEVDAVAETSNLATTRILRAFAPRLRPGGRLIVVASALGTLDKLDDRIAARFAAVAPDDLEAVDALVAEWRRAVHAGRAEADGFGTWLNIPSKVAQVAAVRALAGERRSADLTNNRLVMALCPGLIDTDASRPWFADMSAAQTPAEAAAWPVKLALAESFDPAFYGELVQFGKVLPWETGVPVPHTAAA
jgi:carbonyl reductase 1